MHFLPDVYVPCEVCKGKRYNRETLEVHYKGQNIADVLEMTVDEALDVLRERAARSGASCRRCTTSGSATSSSGQPATTLSGGEAQRVKLATELSKRGHRPDALHPRRADHRPALRGRRAAARRCCSGWSTPGNTVLVIEHNLDVIKTADWVIDLGPEGGAAGGDLVKAGTPEEVARSKTSHTGRYLRHALGMGEETPARRARRREPAGRGRIASGMIGV